MPYNLTTLPSNTTNEHCTFAPLAGTETVWEVEFRAINGGATQVYIAGTTGFDDYIRLHAEFFDIIRIRLDATNYEFTSDSLTTNDGQFHTYKVVSDGTEISAYVDGVEIGTRITATVQLNGFSTFFRNASSYSACAIEYFKVTENGAVTHNWSADDSNTGNTSAQPIFVDTVGANNATGVNFPTDGTAWGGTSSADTTAPTISSASVPTAGDTIAVQMSESIQVGAGGSGGWTISLGDATISSAAVDGTDNTIINLTPSRTLTSSDSFTIGYTQPGDGFQDQAATPNDLATLSGQAVTNNSTQVAQVPGISAQTIRDKAGDLTPNATNLKIAVRESSDPESTVHYSTTTGSLNGSSQTAAINLGSAGVNVGDTVHFSYFNPALNEGLNVDLTAEDIS